MLRRARGGWSRRCVEEWTFGRPECRADGNAFISASTRHRIPGIDLGDSLSDAVRVVETALAG